MPALPSSAPHCPALAPIVDPFIASAGPLLTMHGIPLDSLATSDILSLFLAADPYPHLSGRDRLPWLLDIVPLAASLSLAPQDRLA